MRGEVSWASDCKKEKSRIEDREERREKRK